MSARGVEAEGATAAIVGHRCLMERRRASLNRETSIAVGDINVFDTAIPAPPGRDYYDNGAGAWGAVALLAATIPSAAPSINTFAWPCARAGAIRAARCE